MNKFDVAANVAFFLLEKTGSVLGKWHGRMSAAEQRAMFGAFIGKGKLWIDGAAETVEHTVKVCFGLDYDVTFSSTLESWDAAVAALVHRQDERKAGRIAAEARRMAKFA